MSRWLCVTEPERCEVCDFQWDSISSQELVPRLRAVGLRLSELLGSCDESSLTRHSDSTWSVTEYGAHVRDAMFNLRDRVIVAAAEDNPDPASMHVGFRIQAGIYADDTPSTLAIEIPVACELMARTVAALNTELNRKMRYGWPRPATRSIRWVAAQALHEAEHHLHDMQKQV